MKTEFEARPVFLQREDRIKANFLTCFLALLVYRLFEHKLNNQFTVSDMVTTLKGMNLCLIDSLGYIPIHRRTDLTDTLHKTFDFRTDLELIKKARREV